MRYTIVKRKHKHFYFQEPHCFCFNDISKKNLFLFARLVNKLGQVYLRGRESSHSPVGINENRLCGKMLKLSLGKHSSFLVLLQFPTTGLITEKRNQDHFLACIDELEHDWCLFHFDEWLVPTGFNDKTNIFGKLFCCFYELNRTRCRKSCTFNRLTKIDR